MNKKLAEIFHREDFQVGDKVEVRDKRQCEVLKIVDNQLLLLENSGTFWWFDYVTNLKIPNVSLDDVLEKLFKKWEKEEEINHPQYVRDWKAFVINGLENAEILEKWQLKKSLWEQSEETQKFVETILKPKET